MPATTYAVNKMIDYNFGGTSASYTPPSTYYLGLSTTEIDATGSATMTEPTDSSYARVALTNNKTTWCYASSGSIINAISASFAQSSEAWGTLVSSFLSSASQDGAVDDEGETDKIWFYYSLDPDLPVVANTVVTFGIGTITSGSV